jgi:hypothetical protein
MLRNTNVGGPSTWNDVLWVSSYTGGDVKGSNVIVLGKNSDFIGFARQNFDAVNWGTLRTIWHSGNITPVPTSRTLTGGSGINTIGNLTANRTISVDSTVIRTTGNQSMSGTKTFTGQINRQGLTTATVAEDVRIARGGGAVDAVGRGPNLTLSAGGSNSSMILQNGGTTGQFQAWTFNGFWVKMINILHNSTIALRGPVDVHGVLLPNVDNARLLGQSGRRWSQVWAANGTIQTSDEREKTEITDVDLGLDFVQKLRPVTYKWKVGENIVERTFGKDEEGNDTESETITPRAGKRKHYGLIAQEVKEVLGDKDFGGYIHDTETDHMGLRYDQFIPILIKAVQEQQEMIDKLKEEIEELKK